AEVLPPPAAASPTIAWDIEPLRQEPVPPFSAVALTDADKQAPKPAPSPSALALSDLWVIASSAWCLGVAVSLLGIALGLWQARQLSRGSRALGEEPWRQLVNALRSRLGLERSVELREHPEPIVPLTCGLIRPSVLLPRQSRTWTDEMRRVVLLHELAHV